MNNPAASLQPESMAFHPKPAAVDIAEAIYAAVAGADWTALPGWDAFATIADAAEPDSMVVYAESATHNGGEITVPADLSVILHYADDAQAAPANYADSFPAMLTLRTTEQGLGVTRIAVTLNRET